MPTPRRTSTDPEATVEKAQRELLLAAIANIQGSIHANDSKTSIGLVVHGLVFAGVLSVASRLGSVADDARTWAIVAGVVLVAFMVACFLVSVTHLLLAAAPYKAKRVAPRLGELDAQVFFPRLPELPLPWWRRLLLPFWPDRLQDARGPEDAFDVPGMHAQLLAKVTAMDDDALRVEYTAEMLKVADILRHEAHHAGIGFAALRAEIYAATAWLVLAGLASVHFGPVTPDRPAVPDLRWEVTGARGTPIAAGTAATTISADASDLPLVASFTGSGEELDRVVVRQRWSEAACGPPAEVTGERAAATTIGGLCSRSRPSGTVRLSGEAVAGEARRRVAIVVRVGKSG